MNANIEIIPLANLLVLLVPVILLVCLMARWSLRAGNAVYSLSRMLVQLLVIGYFLSFIFQLDSAWLVLSVLSVMALASSWIALGSLGVRRAQLFKASAISVLGVGSAMLLLITQLVLNLQPWYQAHYVIPLAGMVFASAMNGLSLAAERILSELGNGKPYTEARNTAMQAAMIPTINSMFAVGLVSLPGMMTGQILSGVSPLIAVRYQIMVMLMLFAATGLSTAGFLVLAKRPLLAQLTGQAR